MQLRRTRRQDKSERHALLGTYPRVPQSLHPGSLSDLPRSGLRTQPGVLTPGTHPTRRVALKGRKVKFGITSEYGLARHRTRSLVMDLGQDKRTILFDAIASYASF